LFKEIFIKRFKVENQGINTGAGDHRGRGLAEKMKRKSGKLKAGAFKLSS
jgi:hypothetical protein